MFLRYAFSAGGMRQFNNYFLQNVNNFFITENKHVSSDAKMCTFLSLSCLRQDEEPVFMRLVMAKLMPEKEYSLLPEQAHPAG